MPVVGIFTTTILLMISGLHVYWALGGSWGLKASIPALPESGKPLFVPSPAAALVVATALAIAAGLVVANFYASSTPVKLATWGMGAVFLLRAMGEFRYVGFFKKNPQYTVCPHGYALLFPALHRFGDCGPFDCPFFLNIP